MGFCSVTNTLGPTWHNSYAGRSHSYQRPFLSHPGTNIVELLWVLWPHDDRAALKV
jgi:hypothetical protein